MALDDFLKVSELPTHHLGTADLAAQDSLVDDDQKQRRVILFKNPLTPYLGLSAPAAASSAW